MDSARFQEYRCPGFGDFPAIPLYKDQVITLLNGMLAPFYAQNDAPVTASMINNYVKQKLITPPEKKKYGREQLVMLYLLFLFKQVLSMEEIRLLLQREFPPEELEARYAHFAHRLEQVLGGMPPEQEHPLLEAAIQAFVWKQKASSLLIER